MYGGLRTALHASMPTGACFWDRLAAGPHGMPAPFRSA